MKLSDIINAELSLYNSLGKKGGTALPYHGKETTIDGITVWQRKNLKESLKPGDSVTASSPGKKTKKVMVRKVGNSSIETIDDEGNHKLYNKQGKLKVGAIHYKNMHTGIRSEGTSGVGPAGLAGANQHTGTGPSELEYDLSKVDDEFKGKDTRADIKKSKDKRITLKQFLDKRTDRETERVTAGAR